MGLQSLKRKAKRSGGTIEKSNESVEDTLSSKSRINVPYENAIELFKSKVFDKTKHDREIKNIIENPIESYKKFKDRLLQHGLNASFPEFEGVVTYVTNAIFNDEDIDKVCASDKAINMMRKALTLKLMSIQLYDDDETFFNRLSVYPYMGTIMVIEDALTFLDVVWRVINRESYPEYYHTLRYRGHLPHMLSKIDNIIFPTCASLGATNFIRLRCVPIHFLGVSHKPVLADHFINTPLDFFSHDVQHMHRQYEEDHFYMEKMGECYNHIDSFHQDMYNTYIKCIHPLTDSKRIGEVRSLLKMDHNEQDMKEIEEYDNKTIKSIQQWIKMIVFEIVHEKGWPLTNYSLCRNLISGYDSFTYDIHEKNEKGLFIRRDKGYNPTVLANIYNKVRYGFFDNEQSPRDYIVNTEHRLAKYLVHAVELILKSTNCSYRFDKKKTLDLILDKTNTYYILDKSKADKEKYTKESQIPVEDGGINEVVVKEKEKIKYPYAEDTNKHVNEKCYKFVGGKNIRSQSRSSKKQ